MHAYELKLIIDTYKSVLFPLMTALLAAIKKSGRFVAGSDLDFHEKGVLTATGPHVGALHGCHVGVFPRLCSS